MRVVSRNADRSGSNRQIFVTASSSPTTASDKCHPTSTDAIVAMLPTCGFSPCCENYAREPDPSVRADLTYAISVAPPTTDGRDAFLIKALDDAQRPKPKARRPQRRK